MAATMRHRGQPIFSVDSSGQVIVAGTSQDVVFWDIRNLKVPMAILEESHGDEVTGVRFNPRNHHKVISCGADQLVNTFDFENKTKIAEEDGGLDNTYCSD